MKDMLGLRECVSMSGAVAGIGGEVSIWMYILNTEPWLQNVNEKGRTRSQDL